MLIRRTTQYPALRRIVVLCAAVCVLSLSGCTPQSDIYTVDTNPVSWSVGELKAVEFDNADTLSLRDIYIIFRYVNENDYGDIPLAISAITPSGLRWTDTVLLRRGEGQQISNVMRDGETLYRHGVLLQEDGRYVFEFNPLREIEGIYSIGVYFYKKRESL